MNIRPATADDARAISDLIRPLSEKYIARECPPQGRENLLASMGPEAIEQLFRCGYRYHVAQEQGVIVGAVGMRGNRHLFHLFVADNFRGQGIARQLWLCARDACRASGYDGDFTVNASRFAVPIDESEPRKNDGGCRYGHIHPFLVPPTGYQPLTVIVPCWMVYSLGPATIATAESRTAKEDSDFSIDCHLHGAALIRKAQPCPVDIEWRLRRSGGLYTGESVLVSSFRNDAYGEYQE